MSKYQLKIEYINKQVELVPLGYSSGKKTDSALLEQLDFKILQFETKEKFYIYLNSCVGLKYPPKNVYISYKAAGEERKLDIILNNKRLAAIAGKNLRRKIRKEKNVKIDTNDEYFKEVLDKIIILSITPTLSNYTISKMPFYVGKKLKEYKQMYKSESNEKYKELDSIKKSIISSLADYNNFRKIVIALEQIKKYENKFKLSEPEFRQITINELEIFDEKDDQTLIKLSEEKRKYEECKKKLANNEITLEEITKLIEDLDARETYIKTNGDVEQIIDELGIDKCMSLSNDDKYAIGINDKMLIKKGLE